MGFGEDACAGAIANTPKAMRYFGSSRNPKPGWRNWQTQQTQNLPTLVVMGVRPPLPALFIYFIINGLWNFILICPCSVRTERCLIVAHLHSGKPSRAGP